MVKIRYIKKKSLLLLPFYMVVATYIMKRCAERCELQLYQISLNGKSQSVRVLLFYFLEIQVYQILG